MGLLRCESLGSRTLREFSRPLTHHVAEVLKRGVAPVTVLAEPITAQSGSQGAAEEEQEAGPDGHDDEDDEDEEACGTSAAAGRYTERMTL